MAACGQDEHAGMGAANTTRATHLHQTDLAASWNTDGDLNAIQLSFLLDHVDLTALIQGQQSRHEPSRRASTNNGLSSNQNSHPMQHVQLRVVRVKVL